MHFARKEDFGSIPRATGGIARMACARLGEMGKDPAPLLAKAGMTAEEARNPAIRLEVRTQIRLLELAAGELQDDLLGFHLARSFDLREIGLLYYVTASSERLEDALRDVERYSRIMNEGVRLRFSLQDRTATIALDYVNVDRRTDRQQIEFWLVALVRMCRQSTDTRLAPSQLKMNISETRCQRNSGCSSAAMSIWRRRRRGFLSGAACSASPCRTRRLSPRAVAAIRRGGTRGQLPGAAHASFEGGGNSAWVAAAWQGRGFGSCAAAGDEFADLVAQLGGRDILR